MDEVRDKTKEMMCMMHRAQDFTQGKPAAQAPDKSSRRKTEDGFYQVGLCGEKRQDFTSPLPSDDHAPVAKASSSQ
jgi:hypothetical protein